MRRSVVLGLAAACAAATLVGCGTEKAPEGGPQSDVAMVCALLEKLPDPLPDSPAADAAEHPAGWDPYEAARIRLATASDLVKIPAARDARYQPLADALARAVNKQASTFELSSASIDVATARTYC